jgi:23S rRNA (uracil747-C5)-methyltransferase
LGPRSFFQTNTVVAEALYDQARAWVSDLPDVRTVWDLYCGVGGFALHLAGPGREVLGVEVSADAIAAASATSAELGVAAEFVAADATAYALASDAAPDLVVVNPPRRGIGPDLAAWLERSGVRHVLYSSCNAESLARDLALMPSLRPVEARVLDMFPHTTHYEVMVLLAR